MAMSFALHTVILTVGPSMCGKSWYCQNTLVPQLRRELKAQGIPEGKVHCISSDSFRRMLIGTDESEGVGAQTNHDKYDQRMIEVSNAAFDLLRHTLRQLLAFPVQSHFVVVDTSGLSLQFHEEMSKLVKEYNYSTSCIIWDFGASKDFFHWTYDPDQEASASSSSGGNDRPRMRAHKQRKVISEQMTKLHRYILPELRKYYETQHHTIKRLDAGESTCVSIEKAALYRSCFLDPSHTYLVVGDVHECLEELRALLVKTGFRIDPETDLIAHGSATAREKTDIVLVGDFIDKGGNTRGIVEFLHKNVFRESKEEVAAPLVFIVRGNHERTNYELLFEVSKARKAYTEESVAKYYTAHATLKGDAILADKFRQLHDVARPFYACLSNDTASRSFYVTHSPCSTKFLGKVDKESLKKQNYSFLDREKPIEGQLLRLIGSDLMSAPFHLAGHINLADAYLGYKRDRNYFIGLDSGAVAGYQLSGVVLGRNYKLPELLQVPASAAHPRSDDNVLPMVQTLVVVPTSGDEASASEATLATLTPRQQKMIVGMVANGVNYISGTVCPAAKDASKGQLESLAKAIEYYWRKDPEGRVIAQIKYMGSRLLFYFFPDAPERCYAVSRKGFRKTFAPHIQTQLYDHANRQLGAWCNAENIDMVLLDGELLPWSALGEGLIQEHFQVAAVAAQTELDTLAASGFEELCREQGDLFREHAQQKQTQKLSHSEVVTKAAMAQLSHTDFGVSIEHKLEALQVYKRQIELHGQPMWINPVTGQTRVDYQMFSILKYRHRGTESTAAREIIPTLDGESEIESFQRVNGGAAHLVIDFKAIGSLEAAVAAAQVFFDATTLEHEREGIVVKPEFYSPTVAPYLKVRCTDYLTLVYDYNFQFKHKAAKLLKQKSIERKLRASINEFAHGLDMLRIPLDALSLNNQNYVAMLVDFVFGKVQSEQEKLDPRL